VTAIHPLEYVTGPYLNSPASVLINIPCHFQEKPLPLTKRFAELACCQPPTIDATKPKNKLRESSLPSPYPRSLSPFLKKRRSFQSLCTAPATHLCSSLPPSPSQPKIRYLNSSQPPRFRDYHSQLRHRYSQSPRLAQTLPLRAWLHHRRAFRS